MVDCIPDLAEALIRVRGEDFTRVPVEVSIPDLAEDFPQAQVADFIWGREVVYTQVPAEAFIQGREEECILDQAKNLTPAISPRERYLLSTLREMVYTISQI